jgi:hypothetical protein
VLLKSILEIKKVFLDLIVFFQLIDEYIRYTVIFLCIVLITAAIHLALTSLAIYISGIFFPKETWILIKIWDRLDKICNKILKITIYLVCLKVIIWLVINVLIFISCINLFFSRLYELIICLLTYIISLLILIFVSISLIKLFNNQLFKPNLKTEYIIQYLLLLVHELIKLIMLFTIILLFLFLVLHSVSIFDYCNKIITRYI